MMRERRARRESLADARPRHREATTRARTSFAGDRAVGATRGVGTRARVPSNRIRFDPMDSVV
jgi:hypothetical protein|tara:strand:+ start:8575 stop:8763 length:189 start_codon:yes stop_codon:yes gene_type:complete